MVVCVSSLPSILGSSKAKAISTSTVFVTIFLFYILTIQSGKVQNSNNNFFRHITNTK